LAAPAEWRDADVSAKEADAVELLIDMIASAVQPLIMAAPAPKAKGKRRRADLELVTAFIDRHLLSTELSPELVAGEFAMSRAVLYRLFEPLGGVAGYVRRRRMEWAAEQFARDGAAPRTIASIAERAGFDSVPAFARAFRAHHGHSPADLRRRSRWQTP
jgi:AraC-like DNA-binding protein